MAFSGRSRRLVEESDGSAVPVPRLRPPAGAAVQPLPARRTHARTGGRAPAGPLSCGAAAEVRPQQPHFETAARPLAQPGSPCGALRRYGKLMSAAQLQLFAPLRDTNYEVAHALVQHGLPAHTPAPAAQQPALSDHHATGSLGSGGGTAAQGPGQPAAAVDGGGGGAAARGPGVPTSVRNRRLAAMQRLQVRSCPPALALDAWLVARVAAVGRVGESHFDAPLAERGASTHAGGRRVFRPGGHAVARAPALPRHGWALPGGR